MTDLALTQDRLELVRRTIAPDLTDSELELFGAVCRRLGLDPLGRQIHAVKRSGRMTIQAGIDGLRLVAQRTGDYAGQEGPHWCGSDGRLARRLAGRKTPAGGRPDGRLPDGASARPSGPSPAGDSYAVPQSPTWKKMPDVMLAEVRRGSCPPACLPSRAVGRLRG